MIINLNITLNAIMRILHEHEVKGTFTPRILNEFQCFTFNDAKGNYLIYSLDSCLLMVVHGDWEEYFDNKINKFDTNFM